MSNLSNAYASYMSHFHKYQPRLDTLATAFNHVYDLIKEGQFIDCGLNNKVSDYPKYPCIYQFFDKSAQFDLWKIHNCALDTVNVLKDYVTDKDALSMRIKLDKIPGDIVKIRNDIYLQYTFFSSVNDLFHLKQHFHDYSELKKIVNHYNSLNELPYNPNMLDVNGSFVHTFLFDFLFRQHLRNATNVSGKLSVYCIDNDIFNKSDIKSSFTSFIDDNATEFFSISSKIILQSLYSMSKIDDTLITTSINTISHNIGRLKDSFNTYIDNFIGYPTGEIIQYVLNSFYLVFGSRMISDLHNNSDIFDQGFIQSTSYSEDKILDEFMNKVSSTSIQNYLFISYLYKFWPIKYINVLPIIMAKYSEEVIKPETSLAFTRSSLESLFSYYISESKVNYPNLIDHFDTNIDNAYLSNMVDQENVVEFAFFLYFTKLFDDFMESDLYNDFIKEIYNDMFTMLRNEGYVANDFNWCTCQILFNLFFKSFIRSQLVSGVAFNSLQVQFKDIFMSVLNNTTGDSKYDMDILFEIGRTKSLYGNVVSSHFEKLHNFIESMYLSTITNQINIRMLGYFVKT